MDVLDLDKTWHYNLQRSALSVGAGVRLASIDQSLRSPVAAAGVNFASLNTKGSFDGVGPTLSISGRKRVSNTNWALFASTRLSALFGDSSSSAVLAGPIPLATEDDGDDLMAVTELQMGVDWSAPVWYSTRLFIRAAMEGQIWHGGGNPGFPLLSTTDGDLGFFGFTLGTGLTY